VTAKVSVIDKIAQHTFIELTVVKNPNAADPGFSKGWTSL